MATLILLGLIALMVITIIVMLLMRKGWKKILLTFAGFLVVLILFNLYVNKTCGPNAKDVKIMTPQAEAISNYILKNGIPESLGEIPGLPYALEKCNRKVVFKNQDDQVTHEQNATSKEMTEECYFNYENKKYNIWFWFVENHTRYTWTHGRVEMVSKGTKTGIDYAFKMTADKTYKISGEQYPLIYSSKNTGICNPMRM